MLTVEGNDIALTRGDSLTLALCFEGRTVPPTARARFSVKRCPQEEAPLIERTLPVTDSRALLRLAPSDTQALPPRTYFWDVRLLYADGTVTTPMDYAAFEVLEVIGNG